MDDLIEVALDIAGSVLEIIIPFPSTTSKTKDKKEEPNKE